MKRILFLLLIASIFTQCNKKMTDVTAVKNNEEFRKKAPAPTAAKPINLGTYSTFDLNNGLKVIVVENHKLPKVSYQLSLAHDPILEGDKAGLSNMAGDLMSKGTKSKSKANIDEAIDFIGASFNTSANGMYGTSLKKHSDKLLEIMTDVLYNATFPVEEFDKLKSQAIDGLSANKTDANAIAENVSGTLTYGKNHPYGEVLTEKSLNSFNADNCKNYVNTYFKPNNAYLVIVGDITPADAKMKAEKYFSNWKKGDIPTVKYATPTSPKQPSVAFANKDGAVQSVINIVWPVDLKIGSSDELACNVMNNILGGGIFSGRLMQNLREKKAYTYGARSTLTSDQLVGAFKAFASVRNAVTDSSVTEFLYELKRISSEPVSEADVTLAKNSMAGGFARSLESPQTIAGFALNTFKYKLPQDYYNTYLSKLEKITVADVQRVASRYITPQNAHILVVGNKDAVAESLLKFDGDQKIDYYDSYGEILKLDNLEIPAGLKGEDVIIDYIDAIGGKEKLLAIKTKVYNATMAFGPQQAVVVTKQKSPDKYYSAMMLNGAAMMEQKFDGKKASISQMGQVKVSNPGEEDFESTKKSAMICEQLSYLDGNHKIEIKGKEDVNGELCYKINITNPNGKTVTEFYNIKNSYLLKSYETSGDGEDASSITTEFKNYKDTNGYLFPYEMAITGVAPFPLVMKISSYELNIPIEDSIFEVK